MKTKAILFLTVIFYTLVACAGQEKKTLPAVNAPIDTLNEYILVTAPAGWNSFLLHEDIGLNIEVIGKEQVVFSPDYGVEMFVYDQGKWIEVYNVPTEYQSGEIILSPSNGNPLMAGGISVYPVVPDSNSPVKLRIFVSGNIYKNHQKTDERVGGYITIILKP